MGVMGVSENTTDSDIISLDPIWFYTYKCDALRDLVPFLQFKKNVKNKFGRVF